MVPGWFGKDGRPGGGAHLDVFLWFELVRCFRTIQAYGFNCFKFQGCFGVLIMIEFEFNFKWGFLVIW